MDKFNIVTFVDATRADRHATKIMRESPNITLGGAEKYAAENNIDPNMFLTALLFSHNGNSPPSTRRDATLTAGGSNEH